MTTMPRSTASSARSWTAATTVAAPSRWASMWRSSRRWWLLCLLALAAMASAQPMPGTVIDLATGQHLDEAAFVKRAANAPRLLLGERHDLAGDHAAQRWLLHTLQQQRPQGAMVLEMIASERQPRLQRVQRWLANGNHADGTRLQELLGWDTRWPWAAYGGLVQDATAAGIPCSAATCRVPRSMRCSLPTGRCGSRCPPPGNDCRPWCWPSTQTQHRCWKECWPCNRPATRAWHRY